MDYPFESGAHYIYLDKTFYLQRQDPPCSFTLLSELLSIGADDPTDDKSKLISLLQDTTFLNYSFLSANDVADVIQNEGSGGVYNILDYNNIPNLQLEVTLANYLGEYELGRRDIAGGCIDYSVLQRKDLTDVC